MPTMPTEDVLVERSWTVGPFDRSRLNGEADLVEHKDGRHIPKIVSVLLHQMEDEIVGLCDLHVGTHGTMQMHRLLLLEEAFVNAAFHGNRSRVEGAMEVSFRISRITNATGQAVYSLDLQISDDDLPDAEGRRFAFENIPDCRIPENLEKGGGRGMLLMSDLCRADISYVRLGTRKRMKFLRMEGQDGQEVSPEEHAAAIPETAVN